MYQLKHKQSYTNSRRIISDPMIKKTNSIQVMNRTNVDQFDSQCVCQICTCQRHKCPHADIKLPFEQISTYQKQYVPHPLKATQKFSTDNSKYLKTSYGYINSSYRENFPGHKPEMRTKIVPRVKDQQKNVPFEGESWTKSTYQPKSVVKDRLRNKDKEFNPDMQPFMGYTTYKSDFFPKRPHSQFSKQTQEIKYPEGYKFNASTTYSNDFIEKPFNPLKSCKPLQKVAPHGKHYLNSTYRDDYSQKRSLDICPVLTLPKYPSKVNYPTEHVAFNKSSGAWEMK